MSKMGFPKINRNDVEASNFLITAKDENTFTITYNGDRFFVPRSGIAKNGKHEDITAKVGTIVHSMADPTTEYIVSPYRVLLRSDVEEYTTDVLRRNGDIVVGLQRDADVQKQVDARIIYYDEVKASFNKELTGKEAVDKIKIIHERYLRELDTVGSPFYNNLNKMRELETKEIREEVLYLKVPNTVKLEYNIDRRKNTSKEDAEKMHIQASLGLSEIAKMVRLPSEGMVISITDKGPKARAYAIFTEVFSGTNDGARIFMHETMHALDCQFGRINSVYDHGFDLNAKAQKFLFRRVGDEKPIPLSVATGNKKYGPDEVTRKDKFFNAYIGKDYGNKSSEVNSMGVEYMWADPLKFVNADEDMFSFIFDSIRGRDVS